MATATITNESRKALVADTLEVIDGLLASMSSAVTLAKLSNASDDVKDDFSRQRLELELKRLRLINDALSKFKAALDENAGPLREATGALKNKLAKIKSVATLLNAATSLLTVLAKIIV